MDEHVRSPCNVDKNDEAFGPDDLNKLVEAKKLNKKTFSLMHLNIRSVPKHFDDFLVYLKTIKLVPSVIGLSETWLTEQNSDLYSIDDYNFVSKNRTNKRGGGVGLFVRSSLDHTMMKDHSVFIEGVMETVFVKIKLTTTKSLIVGNVYRPPNSDYSMFSATLESLLEEILRDNKYVYLMGDFNLDLKQYGKKLKDIDAFYDTMSSFGLEPLIHTETRVTNVSKTLIDNIFTNEIENVKMSGTIVSDVSDHFPVFSVSNRKGSSLIEMEPVFKRKLSEKGVENFKHVVASESWNDVYAEVDANKACDLFSDIIQTAYCKAFPKVMSKPKQGERLPWVNRDIRRLAHDKYTLHKMFLKNGSLENERKYKVARNLLLRETRKARKEYFTSKMEKSGEDSQKTWKVINELLGKTPKSTFKSPKTLVSDENCVIDNPKEIVEKFNDYFSKVGPNLAEKIPQTNKTFDHYLKGSYANSFYLYHTDKGEIERVVQRYIRPNKASGYDEISPKIVRETIEQLADPLSHIINLSFDQGVFPEKLKLALVTPIFKDDNPNECQNYRPISVLTVFSKIYEKLYAIRLLKFLTKYSKNTFKFTVWL